MYLFEFQTKNYPVHSSFHMKCLINMYLQLASLWFAYHLDDDPTLGKRRGQVWPRTFYKHSLYSKIGKYQNRAVIKAETKYLTEQTLSVQGWRSILENSVLPNFLRRVKTRSNIEIKAWEEPWEPTLPNSPRAALSTPEVSDSLGYFCKNLHKDF